MSTKSTMCLMYLLRELMRNGGMSQPKQQHSPARKKLVEEKFFGKDETESIWHKEQNVHLLLEFCREGYSLARQHGHFLVGNSDEKSYIGIPGRFFKAEQPALGETGFTLWQPIRGGEELYESLNELEEMAEEKLKLIYGYWIAEIDPKTLKLSEPH